ncbi:hypothetical protein KPSB59_3300035 [Klebsiella quasipneumoniae subsp. quasipneumoniae]|nr:hypothetical protein KPSB59_3300035 [Klebsiella quasipneumoniae subsp. quasipneumoniae]
MCSWQMTFYLTPEMCTWLTTQKPIMFWGMFQLLNRFHLPIC